MIWLHGFVFLSGMIFAAAIMALAWFIIIKKLDKEMRNTNGRK